MVEHFGVDDVPDAIHEFMSDKINEGFVEITTRELKYFMSKHGNNKAPVNDSLDSL